MSNKPRKFWQIHLSTAILISLAAGALLFLNLRQGGHDDVDRVFNGTPYGFPCVAATRYWVPDMRSLIPRQEYPHPLEWNLRGVIINVAVAAAVIGSMGLISEYLIRPRSKP